MRVFAALTGLLVALAFAVNTLGGSGAATVDQAARAAVVKESTLTEPGELDPKAVKALVLRLDALMDKLGKPEQHPSQQDMLAWTYEVLPYFTYERMRMWTVIPDDIRFVPYLEGGEHQHILGRAYCESDRDIGFGAEERPYPYNIEINARLTNPHSSWYGDPSYLSTLIHELAHVQGLCGDGAESEHAAQVVMLEILAALVNGGNREALYPLLDELRSWGMSYMLYDAINGNTGSKKKLDEYREFRDGVYADPFDTARSEKSLRHWQQQGMNELATLLHTYSVAPLTRLLEGLKDGGVRLHVPAFHEDNHRPWDRKPYRGIREFQIDDLVALLPRLEALVAEASR